MEQEYPNYILKRKRLSKTKTVLIFRRNNLSKDDFKFIDGKYVFREEIEEKEFHGVFRVTVNSNNWYDILDINQKSMKVQGGENHFGIFLRFADQMNFPISKHTSHGTCMEIGLELDGYRLRYDPAAKKPKKNQFIGEIHQNNYPAKPLDAPLSVSYAAAHPFQGGACSPK